MDYDSADLYPTSQTLLSLDINLSDINYICKELENEFNITIDDNQINHISTIEDIITIVRANTGTDAKKYITREYMEMCYSNYDKSLISSLTYPNPDRFILDEHVVKQDPGTNYDHEITVSFTNATIQMLTTDEKNAFHLRVLVAEGETSLKKDDEFFPFKDKHFYMNKGAKIIFNVFVDNINSHMSIDQAYYDSNVVTQLGTCSGSLWTIQIPDSCSVLPKVINNTMSLKYADFIKCNINISSSYIPDYKPAYAELEKESVYTYGINDLTFDFYTKKSQTFEFYITNESNHPIYFSIITDGQLDYKNPTGQLANHEQPILSDRLVDNLYYIVLCCAKLTQKTSNNFVYYDFDITNWG